MKIKFIAIILYHFASILLANETPSDPLTGKFINDPRFREQALEIPQVQNIFSECEKQSQNNKGSFNYKQVESCFNQGFQKLPANASSELYKKLKNFNPDSADQLQFRQSPVYKKLTEYFFKNIEKDLYGTNSDDKSNTQRKFVDHGVFYDMMDSYYGKSLIYYISSFCIDADSSANYLISNDAKEREQQRTENIKLLSLPSKQEKMSMGAEGFMGCMQILEHICGKTTYQSGNSVLDFSDDSTFGSEASSEDIAYTRTRACATSRQLKEIRSKMIAFKDMKKTMDENASKSKAKGLNFAVNSMYQNGFGDKEKSLDEITSTSSGDIVMTSGLGEAAMKKAQDMQKCIQSPKSDECAKMAMSEEDKNEAYKGIKDYQAKTQIAIGKIKSMNEDELKKHLSDNEGWSPQLIEQTLAQAAQIGGLEELKKKIAQRYEDEAKSVIESKRAKIELLTPTLKDSPQEASATWKRLADSQSKDIIALAQLTAYDNIVKASLTAENKQTGAKSMNKIPAEREQLNSALNPELMQKLMALANQGSSKDTTAQMPVLNAQEFSKLQQSTNELIQSGGSGNKNDKKSSTTLDIDTLNQHVLKNYLDEDTNKQNNNNSNNSKNLINSPK